MAYFLAGMPAGDAFAGLGFQAVHVVAPRIQGAMRQPEITGQDGVLHGAGSPQIRLAMPLVGWAENHMPPIFLTFF